MTTNDNLRGLKALLPDLDEALEQLEMHGRHSDQGYRKLKDWYRKVALATKAIDAALAEPDIGEVVPIVLPKRKDTSGRKSVRALYHEIGYNAAISDFEALNKAPAKAEPGVKCVECGEPTACGKIFCEDHSYELPKEASTDE